MVSFYLSLGANIGDRFEHLKKAIQSLLQVEGIFIHSISGIYETEPVGFVDQPAFLNMVVGGETGLTAEQLLQAVWEVERKQGRVREIRWGPRTLDIDILIYGQEMIVGGNLEIPHPRMQDRLFVLIPFAEIAAEQPIPIGKNQFQTPSQLLENVKDKSGVYKWKDIDWETELELIES